MNPQFKIISFLIALVCCISLPFSINAQFIQQGSKLVGTGAFDGGSQQGHSVALSSDGNTAIVGGPDDSDGVGAVWVYIRGGPTWTQQGNKLVGTGAIGGANQGWSVALSGDGNTAIVGGLSDRNYIGATWIFTRSGVVWTQQGNKLVGTPLINSAHQGKSVSISADGNTAIIGGLGDTGGIGAGWIFTRSGGAWTQQAKLVGSDAVGSADQGSSVSLSADGNTAIIGGAIDSNAVGAAWIFTRSSDVWTQQGGKLVGSASFGVARQGSSVSISADGNTAIVGGPDDNIGVGATWVFTRTAGVWTQQGNKLVAIDAIYGPAQGASVSLSADGNTAIVGGPADSLLTGAAWIYKRNNGVWTQQGNKLVGTGAGGTTLQGYAVSLSGDGNTAMVGGPSMSSVWIFNNSTLGVSANSNTEYNYQLSANYPNPFNPATKITYSIPKETYVSLIVYDLLGREVTRLIQETKLRGRIFSDMECCECAERSVLLSVGGGNVCPNKEDGRDEVRTNRPTVRRIQIATQKLSVSVIITLLALGIINSAQAQSASDSLMDCFPLAVGNEWLYHSFYLTPIDEGMGAIVDSGTVRVTMLSKSPSLDNVLWQVAQVQRLRRFIYDGESFCLIPHLAIRLLLQSPNRQRADTGLYGCTTHPNTTLHAPHFGRARFRLLPIRAREYTYTDSFLSILLALRLSQ